MSFALSQQQEEIRDLVRRAARERIAARASEIDRSAEYPQDMYELLRDLGLFAVPFDAAHGGAGSTLAPISNRYMRNAKVLQIVEGTNQIQRNIIGRSLLGARS